jgi:predicted deacylase
MEKGFSDIQLNQFKEHRLSGRYITLDCIEPILKNLGAQFHIAVEGFSEEQRPLHSITIGTGEFKVLMWSQMHGNESTTTKSIFDFLNYLALNGSSQAQLKDNITIKILPMLNPDGALRYTRGNANGTDLNRDAKNKSQSEIQTLFKVFEIFKPDLCLNMHDQRTIFSAGDTPNSAVVSFLAPSADTSKSITKSRVFAMQLIASMNNHLQKFIPGNVGRYSDEFNPNCLGDTFQSLKVPTILFEAGHCGDYQREDTRKYVFIALLNLFETISEDRGNLPAVADYFKIPENEKLFFDIIIRNAIHSDKTIDVAIQFEEKLVENDIIFIPKVTKTGGLSKFYGHKNVDAAHKALKINEKEVLPIGSEIIKLTIDGYNILMI